MKFEVLKRSHLKKNIIIGVIVVLLLSAIVLTFTKAKYRVTESVPLVTGTINFSPSDLNLIAVYLNKNGETLSSDKVPHVGYTLNTEQSICEVNGEKDETIQIAYENGLLNFLGLGRKGTKCTAYFDLIPDSENPVISGIGGSSSDDSITVTVETSDNIGVYYYYYYKLDDGEEIRSEEASYTFDNLENGRTYMVNVRAEDAAGNVAEISKSMIVGLKGGDYILATTNAPVNHATDWTGNESYYYTGKPNNWAQFAGFWWRIIRINGDGTVRMIYQGTAVNETGNETQIGTGQFNSSNLDNKYVGYMYGITSYDFATTHANTNSSSIKVTLDNWYTNNLASYSEYIDGNAGFCGDRTISEGYGYQQYHTYYTAFRRSQSLKPSLECSESDIYTTIQSRTGNKALTLPIGLISSDEAILDGIDFAVLDNSSSFLYTSRGYWTMSPSMYDKGSNSASVMFVPPNPNENSYAQGVSWSWGIRPVINLRADIPLTGAGTVFDPFKVVGA